MNTLTIREPIKTNNFWEHYTDIGHNNSKYGDPNSVLDWLWIWVDECIIAQERAIGFTHSQMNLPGEADYHNCFRGSYDVSKKSISVTKPLGRISQFRDTPSTIIAALSREFPEAVCLIDFGT